MSLLFDLYFQERAHLFRRSVRSTYYRNINAKYPVLRGIGDPAESWETLTKTWEDRQAGTPGSYVIVQNSSPPLLALSSALDLEMLHGSRHWVCDGTFSYKPSMFSQLYSIHGFVHGEAVPLVVGLLPDKTAATYTVFFQAVKDALEGRYA